jgi:hypothetical protein
LPCPNRTQQWCQRLGCGHASFFGGFADTEPSDTEPSIDLASNECSTWSVVQTEGQRQYDAGYQAARAACLRTGSAAAALSVLEAKRDVDNAYAAGFEWALWDYNDANGLRNGQIVRRA